MSETPFSSNFDELSAEDLAVLQAFDTLDDLAFPSSLDEQNSMQSSSATLSLAGSALDFDNPEDMLILFASEADEDIGTIRRALQQVEQDNHVNSPGLISVGRAAHKLKGTAGAMGCEAISTIALQMEEEIQLIKDGKVSFLSGVMALVHAINALEMTLQSVVNDGQESVLPLQQLAQDLAALHMYSNESPTSTEPELPPLSTIPPEILESSPATNTVQVDTRYVNALMSHTEHLIELQTPLENAQKQVTQSLIELQAAHARLRRLEGLLSSITFNNTFTSEQSRSLENRSASSLVTRILHEAIQRTGLQSHSKQHPPTRSSETPLWDEMEMDRFTENKILLQSFNEAVSDVATATAQLQGAFTQLHSFIEQQTQQATIVRNDVLRLRSAPFSVLLARVQRTVQTIAQTHNQVVQFEASGETTEIDQDILEFLAGPLLHMVRTNLAEGLLAIHPSTRLQGNAPRYRIWLYAQVVGNEIAIELGFSLPIPGGTLEELRLQIQQLQGSITPQRNPAGGVSYHLRFPRTQGIIQGWMVMAGGQGLVLPLTHVQPIDYNRRESYTQLYNVGELLGFPPIPTNPNNTLPPVILLAGSHKHNRVALQVDEIIGEVELVMKPLPAHLQRPGITGCAVDGSGNVLLILDAPALIQYDLAQRRMHPIRETSPVSAVQASTPQTTSPITILVADDSVYIRQSLRSTFERAGYHVAEARDGIEVLEYLSSEEHIPAVLMLDIEMPNLNGYDLLHILQTQPGIGNCKTIMLTSRASEKHRQRALELGAYDFLTKPCAPEVLLETVQRALKDTCPSMQK